MPTVNVLYFAALRERRGRASETLEVTDGTTARGLYLQLFPPGPDGELPVGYVCNQAHVEPGTRLQDGDEVAFLPPLGGG